MSDKTNDTYVAEDADGTPCLWLRTPGSGMNELLASKDDVRVMVNVHKPNASWGAPSRDVYVDRLWDAIAATAGEAPKNDADAEPTPELVTTTGEHITTRGGGTHPLTQCSPEFCHYQPGPEMLVMAEQVEADLAQDEQAHARYYAQAGVPVEEVREVVETLLSLANAAEYQEPKYDDVNAVWRQAAQRVAALLPAEPTS